MRVVLAASALVVASAPAGVFAAEYMTADAAAKLMFPGADSFEARNSRNSMRKAYGEGLPTGR
jgi:hypothetical protein